MQWLHKLPYVIIALLCLTVGLLEIGNNQLQSRLDESLLSEEITLSELATERMDNANIYSLLEDSDLYAETLEQQISALESKPQKVKYVIRTEVVLTASPVVTVKEIPDDYTFRLSNGLAVAGIERQADTYDLVTYDLLYKGQLVVTEKQANVSVFVSSSEAPTDWKEVPVALTALSTEHKTTIEPHLGVAMAVQYPLDLSAGIWSTIVHTPKNVDIGGLTVLVDNDSATFGVIPLAYNLGAPLPLFTNIWLAPAVTIDTHASPGASLLLGAKL